MTRPTRIEIEVNSIPCPFSRCRQQVALLRHAPSSDRLDEMVTTVEQHVIAGPNYWYQTWCPASHLLIPLSARGRQVLAENEQRWVVANAQRINLMHALGETDYETANRRIEEMKRRGELGHIDGPGEWYYPPRPSDVEEAQEQYGAGAPAPEGVELHAYNRRRRGQNTGGSSVSSSNETTISLMNMAKSAISGAQEDCAAATHIVELLDAKLASVNELLNNAAQLVAAGAMGGPGTPALADEAAINVAVSATHVDEASARAAGVLTKVNDAFQAAHHAVEKIDEFIAQISR